MDGTARSSAVSLSANGTGLQMGRERENLVTTAHKVAGKAKPDIAGRYRSAELGADIEIDSTNGVLFAGFDGLLGKGAMHAMQPFAEDIWLVSCKRSMDAPAPGDWTVRIHRDGRGAVSGLTIGCWLARQIDYIKID